MGTVMKNSAIVSIIPGHFRQDISLQLLVVNKKLLSIHIGAMKRGKWGSQYGCLHDEKDFRDGKERKAGRLRIQISFEKEEALKRKKRH